MKRVAIKGIRLKKKFGQHFLHQDSVVCEMLSHVDLNNASVFEIGPGAGFLTRFILQKPVKRLWVFEIDPEWAQLLQNSIQDSRITVFEQNILDVDFSRFAKYAPWILLANIPYQITFPILYLLQRNRHILKDGVIMIQEEVAQKLIKKSGRGYGLPSLFFNHYFEIKLLSKVPPTAFKPPPKVFSRLVYLKPRAEVAEIPDEEKFWIFIQCCFRQPRRTLSNNLVQTHYDVEKIPESYLVLRSQQMAFDDFLKLWDMIR